VSVMLLLLLHRLVLDMQHNGNIYTFMPDQFTREIRALKDSI